MKKIAKSAVSQHEKKMHHHHAKAHHHHEKAAHHIEEAKKHTKHADGYAKSMGKNERMAEPKGRGRPRKQG